MSSMFTSLLPFLAALKRQNMPSPQDQDESNPPPNQFDGSSTPAPTPAQAKLAWSGDPAAGAVSGPSQGNPASTAQQQQPQANQLSDTKGQQLMQLLQSGLQSSNQNQAADVPPPDTGLGFNDPNQTRKTLNGLMRGIGQQAPPRWGPDNQDLYDLAKTMVPGGGSKNADYVPVGPAQDNIGRNLPLIMRGLRDQKLDDPEMVKYALATIQAETNRFAPVSEGVSRGTGRGTNTTPNGQPFDKYDFRTDLGNNGVGDGALYRGRGFIQITGRNNYDYYGNKIGHPELVDHPEMANDPAIAGQLFAAYIKNHETGIRAALKNGDLWEARRLVNGPNTPQSQGGTEPNGLAEFSKAYRNGGKFLASLQPQLNVPGMKPQPLPNLFSGTPPPPVLGDPEQ